ncbi:MAG: phosphoribosyltransferase [Elusimicrobiota bacterium]|jgi:hypothetical protein|nr:phosphoribosyltransferase [Elusimicrobiota bacterium]
MIYKGWNENFPNVLSFSSIVYMKKHPLYTLAKKGSNEAALNLVCDIMQGKDQQEKMYRIKYRYSNAIIVPIRAIEKEGLNKIPFMLAKHISESVGLEFDSDIIQSEKVGRTGENAWHRLAFRPIFEGKVKAGREYILIDDVVTGGGTLNELRNYIESNGGKVVFMAAMGCAQFSSKIALCQATLLQLETQYNKIELSNFLKEEHLYGGNYKALTESEARTILGARTIDEARKRIFEARNAKSRRLL